jgi:conjugative relaxase-like TrwC/TraI family protein
MLSIQWIQNIDYYLDQATADYYFRPGEPRGRWFGKGAKSLGLIGFVTAEQLRPLTKGFSPSGRALIHNAGSNKHRQAWDLTFSAPKSVSVLWSQADRATRLRIGKLHHKAIKVALDYLTEVALFTRRGKNGTIREVARPIVAIFEHSTSRELDPNLHSHCVLLNVAGRQDGKYGAILSSSFYRHKLSAGAIYQAQFAHLLKHDEDLRLLIERQDTAFGLVGVPQKLVKHYSSRRTQIEDHLKAKGFHSAKAASVAALDTRKAKRDRTPPRGELLRRWQKTNSTFGFTENEAQRLLGRAAIETNPPCLKKAIALGVATLLESESYFSEQLLIRNVARQAVGDGVSAAHIIDQVRAYLACDPDLVSLGTYHQEAQYTTHEMLELEKELFALIRAARKDTSHRVPDDIVQRLLDERLPLGPNLTNDELARNTEQRKAVLAMTRTTGAIKVLEGMAGTGKTYVFSIVADAWEQAGYNIQGMALSAVAARNLEEGSGAKSQTIAKRLLQLDSRGSYLRHHKRQIKRLLTGKRTYAYLGPSLKLNRKSAMIIDESGMVGTRQMIKMLTHIRKAGALALLAGDRLQLQPIEAGGPFIRIANLSAGGELRHVIRQKLEPDDPIPSWHRQAGKLIALGKAEDAMKLFGERGRLRVYRDLDRALFSMVRNWSVQGISDPNNNICLAGTLAAVARLNTMCQSARLSGGVLGSDSISIKDYRLHINDTVLFTKNSLLCGVDNGDRGVVLGFNHLTGTMAVRLYATSRTVFIPYRRYKDVQLGYAMTTHKAQGATIPSVHVLLGGPMQDLHLSYVQATRACESTRLYVDKLSAGPKLKHVIKQMTRERLKKLAHDVIDANPSHVDERSQPLPAATSPLVEQTKSIEPSVDSLAGDVNALNPTAAGDPIEGSTSPSHIDIQTNDQVAKPVPGPDHENRNTSSSVTSVESAIPFQSDKQPATIPNGGAQSATKTNSTEPKSVTQALAAITSSRKAPVAEQTTPKDAGSTSDEKAVPPISTREDLNLDAEPRIAPFESSRRPGQRRIPRQFRHRGDASDHGLPDENASQLIPVSQSEDQCTAIPPIAAPPPKAKSTVPPRDILDVSHVQVSGTTDVKPALAAVDRYGKLPGGIVVEGEAECDIPILSLAIDPTRPTHFLINNSLAYDTGLTAEEVALLWHAVFEEGHATNDFGVLSQIQATGISDDTVIAAAMMQSDNALGGIIYGYDAQFRLANPAVPAYRNPFLRELGLATVPEVIDRLFVNHVEQLEPRIFLKVPFVQFVQKSTDVFGVNSTKVTAILTATKNRMPVTMNGASIAANCFPEVHDAFQHFLRYFRDYAREVPDLARTIAYAEVVCLLRRAKAANAALAGQAHVLRLLAQRQQLPLPRFNYTLRSQEFTTVVADKTRQLARIGSNSYDDLKSAVVGFEYARQVGDFSTWETCKRKALQAYSQLAEQNIRTKRRHKPFLHLVALADRIQELGHDVLIDGCIQAAFSSQTKQAKESYLREALSHCQWWAMVTQDTTTRCNRLEIESYLDRTFDPVPALTRMRGDDPSSIQPYSVLTKINTRRRHSTDLHASPTTIPASIEGRKEELGFAKLAKQDIERWNTIEAGRSADSTLWLLDELHRLGVAASDFLSFGKEAADRPLDALWQLAAKRLKPLPATSFSTRLLHCDSPFFASQELLRHETPDMLAKLFAATQARMAWLDPAFDASEESPSRDLLSMFVLTNPERWWRQFLQSHALASDNDASKAALLLAYEMKVRSVTVQQLHQVMRPHQTQNPQAALFFFDLEVSEKARQNKNVHKTLKK